MKKIEQLTMINEEFMYNIVQPVVYLEDSTDADEEIRKLKEKRDE